MPFPLNFSERTKECLPNGNNLLLAYMADFEEFTNKNGMYINRNKSKVMKFSRSQSHDFPLEVSFSDNECLEVVSSMKLLGVIVSDSLKWGQNTDFICKKAKSKIWLLRNMKESGLTDSQLVDAYKKEVRSLVELAVPVWCQTYY